METAIRVGKTPFYATDVFPYGLSRSSYFNKRESDELIKYGQTLLDLQTGVLTPENEDELTFLSELRSDEESQSYSVKLWKKYLQAVEKRGTFHGFSMSNRFMNGNAANSGRITSFDFAS